MIYDSLAPALRMIDCMHLTLHPDYFLNAKVVDYKCSNHKNTRSECEVTP